mmetsp:Transcript_18054/g.30480  ORF Transcript_18054/g.30480 Transcript_18054/m.30480 type:complete len:200 (-) Transcript_18054:226-825(-)
MELHKLQILHGKSGARSHGAAVACACVSGCAGLVGAPETARRNDGGMRSKPVDGTIFHAHGYTTQAFPVITHDQVHGKVFHEEEAVKLQGHAIQGVENGMACAVRSSRATIRLAAFAKFQALSTKSTLINLALRSSAEGQTKGFQLQNDLGCQTAHVLNGVLVAQPICALHGVIGVPAPIIFRHVGQGTIDATLRCNCV